MPGLVASQMTDADGVMTATEVLRPRLRLVLVGEGQSPPRLELGSIDFQEAAEYRADVQLHAWTPAETGFTTRVKRVERLK